MCVGGGAWPLCPPWIRYCITDQFSYIDIKFSLGYIVTKVLDQLKSYHWSCRSMFCSLYIGQNQGTFHCHTRKLEHSKIGKWEYTRELEHSKIGKWEYTRELEHSKIGKGKYTRELEHSKIGKWKYTRELEHSKLGKRKYVSCFVDIVPHIFVTGFLILTDV